MAGMGKEEQKKVNQTFSIPIDVSKDLHIYVKKREMSQFVSDAIRKELACKKDELRKAYISSNTDEGQAESMEDWKDTIKDGSNEW